MARLRTLSRSILGIRQSKVFPEAISNEPRTPNPDWRLAIRREERNL